MKKALWWMAFVGGLSGICYYDAAKWVAFSKDHDDDPTAIKLLATFGYWADCALKGYAFGSLMGNEYNKITQK